MKDLNEQPINALSELLTARGYSERHATLPPSGQPFTSRADDHLEQEHKFGSAILDIVGALVVVLDRNGHILRYNRACEEATGYSFDEIRGRSLWEMLIAPEEIAAVKNVFETLRAGQFPSHFENYWVSKDGSRRLIEWSNTILLGSNGEVEYVIGTGIDVTQRRHAEAAQRELLTRYEATFQTAAIGIAHVAPDGRWLRVNQKLCDITGYSHDELLARTFMDITHPEDFGATERETDLLLKGKIPSCSFEKRYIHKNGQIVWVNITVSLVLNSSGQPDYFTSFTADITDRKRVEIALRETESRFELVIDQATVVIFLKDREGRYALVNNEYSRVATYRREEVIGKNDFELFPRSIAEQLQANDRRIWESGTPSTVEETVLQPDGMHTYLTKKFLIMDTDGKPHYLCGIAADITERKRTADALKENEQHLRRVLDSLYAFVGVLAPDGTLLEASRAPLEAAGLRLDDLRGKKFWECYWWNYSPAVQAQLITAVERAASGEPSRYDTNVRIAHGEMITIDFMIAPMRNSEGRITHLVPSAVDITERKRLEREVLEISSREQRRIGQDLHDDLCQRLSATELLAHALALNLEDKDPVEAAKAFKVAGYIRETISHTRLLARGLSPVNVTVDGLSSALGELASDAEQLFQIRCRFECPASVRVTNPETAMHIYRIAQESISNAVRHGRATEIVIRLEPRANRMCLLLSDNGCGIPKPSPKTTGMGLRIMQHRAWMIGAMLEVCAGKTGGTEVTCVFPQEL